MSCDSETQHLTISLVCAALSVTSCSSISPAVQGVNRLVGAKTISIPPPVDTMVEATGGLFQVIEGFAPEEVRLVVAYTSPEVQKGFEESKLVEVSQWATVSVFTSEEYYACSAKEFREFAQTATSVSNEDLGALADNGVDQFLQNYKRNKGEDLGISYSTPTVLGTFFQMQDAFAFGMIVPYEIGGEDCLVAAGTGFLRVKERVLVFALYSRIEGEETLDWLRVSMEAWATSVLEANS